MTNAHAPSYYAATAHDVRDHAPLAGARNCDVAIIGGGYTGLSAALHLAQNGVDVAVLEAHRLGWGASGRNGGQIHNGIRPDQHTLEKRLGRDDARKIWELSLDAAALVRSLIAEHAIDCDLRQGIIHALHKRRYIAPTRRYLDHLRRAYSADHFDWLETPALAQALGTDHYHEGYRDRAQGHLHALNFALGLGRAAHRAGATIYEQTRVTEIASTARTAQPHGWRLSGEAGTLTADTVIVACNGYLEGLCAEVAARVMPINNFILTTRPLGARQPIAGGEAAADSRFVVYYWRPTADGRLLFGGGETYSPRFPADIAAFVRRHLLRIYPQLADVRIDYAWGGTLAVTVHRFPLVRRLRSGVYTAGGYSGQGVAMGTLGGKILAGAITGAPDRLDLIGKLSCPAFPGGTWLRRPALVAAMSYYALRDRL